MVSFRNSKRPWIPPSQPLGLAPPSDPAPVSIINLASFAIKSKYRHYKKHDGACVYTSYMTYYDLSLKISVNE